MQTALEVFTALWVFGLGTCVGSFLNVVVYRLPRGMSLVSPPSRCSSCLTPIPGRFNIPIISWLVRRGRCVNCCAPIPSRYVLVELACGCIFLGLLWGELVWMGTNLPGEATTHRYGVAWTVWSPQWGLIGQVLYHVGLLVFLLAAAMIAGDEQPLPWSLVGAALGLGILTGTVFAGVYPVLWNGDLGTARTGPVDGFFTGLCGAAAGTAVGYGLRWTAGTHAPRRLSLVCGLPGLYLGWQAGVVLAACALLLTVGGRACGGNGAKNLRFALASLVGLSLAHIVWWKPIAGWYGVG